LSGNSKPLVIINGLGAPRAASQVYGLYFRRHGFRVYTVPQTFMNIGDIRKSAKRVDQVVRHALEKTVAERTPLIGISLGGLIGLYYVYCGGGKGQVDTFISLGGPLSGSQVARIGILPPFSLITSLKQTRPDSEVFKEIRAAGRPEGIRLLSVGTRGDFMTPAKSRLHPDFETVDTPHGTFPIGHWCLYANPNNLMAVLELL